MARPNKLRTAKLQPAALAWLKAYLSGGPRSAKEIQVIGATQGFGLSTLNKCKVQLGLKSDKRGHVWFWRDPNVKGMTSTPMPTVEQIEERVKADLEQTIQKRFSDLVPKPVVHKKDEGWSDKDCEEASYAELLKERREVMLDLEEAERWHGTKRWDHDLEEDVVIDLSEKIEHLQNQLQRIDSWAEKKFSE